MEERRTLYDTMKKKPDATYTVWVHLDKENRVIAQTYDDATYKSGDIVYSADEEKNPVVEIITTSVSLQINGLIMFKPQEYETIIIYNGTERIARKIALVHDIHHDWSTIRAKLQELVDQILNQVAA